MIGAWLSCHRQPPSLPSLVHGGSLVTGNGFALFSEAHRVLLQWDLLSPDFSSQGSLK